jgi:hypothetical protein
LAQILDNGHGALKLEMVGGDPSALLVDLSGLEFGNALLSALGMPKRAQVACFITEAGLDRGDFRLRSLVLDTSEARVTGTGGANPSSRPHRRAGEFFETARMVSGHHGLFTRRPIVIFRSAASGADARYAVTNLTRSVSLRSNSAESNRDGSRVSD